MLADAGVTAKIDPAAVDEAEIKLSFRASGMIADETVEALAELKATRVSQRHPGTVVIGADQMLEVEGDWLDKPVDLDAARGHLDRLRGRRHRLVSVVVVAIDGARVWHATDAAKLTMRPFTDDFRDRYLASVGEDALHSVGAYQLEGLGAQLFSRVEGDFFTILGMPLLPLLEYLRIRGVLVR